MLRFNSQIGKNFHLETIPNLSFPNWLQIGALIEGTGQELVFSASTRWSISFLQNSNPVASIGTPRFQRQKYLPFWFFRRCAFFILSLRLVSRSSGCRQIPYNRYNYCYIAWIKLYLSVIRWLIQSRLSVRFTYQILRRLWVFSRRTRIY